MQIPIHACLHSTYDAKSPEASLSSSLMASGAGMLSKLDSMESESADRN